MKIFFNRQPVAGPWGGGSKVLSAIVKECMDRNHEVTYDLNTAFDLIFCFDPRPDAKSDFHTLLRSRDHNGCKIIQRVGDLGTHGKPELLDLVRLTAQMADLVVFPSAGARDHAGINNKNLAVIPNAPLRDFIVERKSCKFNSPVRLVTHHWSNNTMKGFDVYEALDDFCKRSGKFTFTFIGRKPDKVLLQNHIPPQDIQGLVDLLPKHDIYITASRQEAGANHVLEAMGMGLPVLYHSDGGSINEYCNERGLAYDNSRMLIEILEKEDLHNMLKMPKYTYSSDIMAKSYVDMIECVFASQYKH